MITNITSIQNPIIKNIHKQTRAPKTDLIVLESQNLLEECLQLKLDVQHFLCTQAWYDKHKHEVKQYYQNTIITTPEILAKLSFNQTPQAFMLVIKYTIQTFTPSAHGNYFILDHISDPGNLGTIVRNAVAFNYNQIFISKNSAFLLNEKVVRSSMSAILKIQVVFYDDLLTLITQLKQLNLQVYASVVDTNSQPLSHITNYQPSALILGNETQGIKTEKVLSEVNKIYIPINGIESLNVASASAIFMYTWSTLRKQCKK